MDDPLYRHAGAGTGGADDGGNLVFVNEFFGDVNRFGRITLGIADDEFDGPSIDTAFFVDFVDRHGGHEFGGVPIKDAGPDRSKKAPILMASSAAALPPPRISMKAAMVAAITFTSFIVSSFSVSVV
jgi:hypothetical protein